jgi:hypothetical protein
MEIIWRDIQISNGKYEVSNTGIVRNKGYFDSMGRHHCMKEIVFGRNTNGYLSCSLGRAIKNKYVHRLVAEAFIPNEDASLHVNHKDGNKHNNSVENLEWVTRSQNDLHKKRTIEIYRYPVLDTETGIFYANAAECYEYNHIPYSYGLFKDKLTNTERRNTTKFIRA